MNTALARPAPGTAFRLVFLMDPWSTLNLETETSLLCMDELMRRGHRVYWLQQEDIALEHATLTGFVAEVVSTAPLVLGDREKLQLDGFDALVVRKDPPFDEMYLHLTYLLEFLPHTTIINSPAALRKFNEKLSTLNWANDCPDTLVTMNVSLLVDFVHKHGRVVLKPLDNCSGREIAFVSSSSGGSIETILRQYINRSGKEKMVLAQAYLPGVKQGDKRIYLVDGEPVGWVNRVPAQGSDLANIHQGATCQRTTISDRELVLSREIGARLKTEGILLAGLDFIDGHLTEVNVTSPSAVRQINAVSGSHLEIAIVDAIVSAIQRRDQDSARKGQLNTL